MQVVTQPLPSNARMDSWTQKTSRLFDPLDDASHNQSKTIRCPQCRETVTVRECTITVLRTESELMFYRYKSLYGQNWYGIFTGEFFVHLSMPASDWRGHIGDT